MAIRSTHPGQPGPVSHPSPPLSALRAFEAAARHLSFKDAAAELSVTPAAISHQIKALEDYFGRSLFDRAHRAIGLTEAARPLSRALTEAFRQIDAAVDNLRGAHDHVLVVSSGPAFAAKWLAPRLWRFTEAHPEIDARISANLAFASFDTDGVDVAIRFGEGRYPGLFSQKLLADAVLPMTSPAYVASLGLKRPSDLGRAALIHDDALNFLANGPSWRSWMEAAGVDGIDAERGLRFTHANHGLDAAAAGAGVVLGRRALAEQDLATGRLVCPFGPELPLGRAFYLVCPDGTQDRPTIAAFRHWLSNEVSQPALMPELPGAGRAAEPAGQQ